MRLRVVSLGAGVQSSVMCLMAAAGEIGPTPDLAVFADTQAEPQSVYDMVDYLEEVLPYEVARVTAGSLAAAVARPVSGFVPIPTFYRGPGGGAPAIGRRQCTNKFKIEPIERLIRARLGLRPRQHWPKHAVVEQWLGISVDEIERAKPARRSAIRNRFPLIEAGLRRADLMAWWAAHAPRPRPALARSACVFCPYRTDAEWLDLTADEFAAAEAVEEAMNAGAQPADHQFLHRRCIPVRAALANRAAQRRLDLGGATDCDSGHCFV